MPGWLLLGLVRASCLQRHGCRIRLLLLAVLLPLLLVVLPCVLLVLCLLPLLPLVLLQPLL